MKKILVILLALFMLPINVSASSFKIKDLTIDLDDDKWYVFTRDNIKNNEELDELELTYEYMNLQMKSQNMYMDAILFSSNDNNDSLEFFIKITDLKNDNVSNLHKYSEEEINDVAKEIIKKNKLSRTDYKIHGDKYKYIEFEYVDQGINIYQFYTVINGKGYNFLLQKYNKLNDDDRNVMYELIDSIDFKLDSEYEKDSKKENNSNFWYRVLVYGVIGGIAGGLGTLVNKKKNKENTN